MGKSKGKAAESEACAYLESQGLKLLESNYSYHPVGEIDLIMQDGEFIVFIEVRHRRQDDFGSPIETITKGKQRKIIRTSLLYLQREKLLHRAFCRFDVIGINTDRQVEWIKNAFDNGIL